MVAVFVLGAWDHEASGRGLKVPRSMKTKSNTKARDA